MSGYDNDEATAVMIGMFLALMVVSLVIGLCSLALVAYRGCRHRNSDGRVLAPPPESRAALAVGAAVHYPTLAAYPLLQPQPQLAAAPPDAHQPPPAYNQVFFSNTYNSCALLEPVGESLYPAATDDTLPLI